MAQILPFDIIHAIARQNRISAYQADMLATNLVYEGIAACYISGMDEAPIQGLINQINAAMVPNVA